MHLISLVDWDADRIRRLLDLAGTLKVQAMEDALEPTLERKTLALVFEKPSMRTRVSFEVAMTQLGGATTYLSKDDVNLGVREPIKDGARVLSRYVDGVAARVYRHSVVEELAAHSSIPIINALSDLAHPCQALGDIMTIREHMGGLEGVRVAFIGDANNVARSLVVACARLGVPFVIGRPEGYGFDLEFRRQLDEIAAAAGTTVESIASPEEAVAGATVVYTDVWASMGQEEEAEERRRAFRPFQVNGELMSHAADGAVFLHCLPAHRGDEVTDEVMESPQSAVFDQAENRLHAERALLQMAMG